MNKRGEILLENVIFIILNVVFLIILFTFLYMQIGNAGDLEERYAKEIALLIDAGRSGMYIELDMSDAFVKAKKEKYKGNIVTINENEVRVQLRDNGGYTYSFFNDVLIEGLDYIGTKYYWYIK